MIDVRSDTVTRPSPTMLQAILNAKVGDDVYDDDPTIKELQSFASKMFAHQGALFFPTGTQAGLCALLAHCQRGDEYIAGQLSHHYKYEGGGASVLGGIQAQPIEQLANGQMPLEKIQAAIKSDDFHFAKTKLLCLENTFWGQPLSLEYMQQAKDLAKKNGLLFHLDGARVCNAAIALNCSVDEITHLFDSVCVCLSKGLGAPAGTLLLGKPDFLARAKRWRKVCGGGMRQSGLLAAAGLIALQEGLNLLRADHQKAQLLADSLNQNLQANAKNYTNMVFFDVPVEKLQKLKTGLAAADIVATIQPTTRMVMHKDISLEQVKVVAEKIAHHW